MLKKHTLCILMFSFNVTVAISSLYQHPEAIVVEREGKRIQKASNASPKDCYSEPHICTRPRNMKMSVMNCITAATISNFTDHAVIR